MSNFNKYFPIVASILVAFIFGLSFLFTKEALDTLQTYQLLGFRFALAAIFMILLRISGAVKIHLKGKSMGGLAVLALFQPILYFICETNGINLSTVSVSGIIISLVPIAVAIIAALVLKERPTAVQIFFIILSIAGVILIVLFTGGGVNLSSHILGVLFLLGAVLSAGFYGVISRKISTSYTPIETTYFMMWVGAIVFNIIAIIQTTLKSSWGQYFSPLASFKVIMSLIYLALISSILAYFLLNYAFSKMEASKVGVFLNLVPVFSVLAGVLFRAETFYLMYLIGGLLVIFGVWGTNRFSQKKLTRSKSSI